MYRPLVVPDTTLKVVRIYKEPFISSPFRGSKNLDPVRPATQTQLLTQIINLIRILLRHNNNLSITFSKQLYILLTKLNQLRRRLTLLLTFKRHRKHTQFTVSLPTRSLACRSTSLAVQRIRMLLAINQLFSSRLWMNCNNASHLITYRARQGFCIIAYHLIPYGST